MCNFGAHGFNVKSVSLKIKTLHAQQEFSNILHVFLVGEYAVHTLHGTFFALYS